jgi:exodeoxyribonuclease VII large subunit
MRMLRPPSAQWRERGLRMHALARRLAAAMRIEASEARHRLATGRSRLRAPATGALDAGLESVARRLTRATAAELRNRDAVLGQWSSRLEAASPQQVLARGYAIVRDGDGSIVRSAAQIRRGQSLDVMLAEGSAEVTVSATRAPGDAPGV